MCFFMRTDCVSQFSLFFYYLLWVCLFYLIHSILNIYLDAVFQSCAFFAVNGLRVYIIPPSPHVCMQ